MKLLVGSLFPFPASSCSDARHSESAEGFFPSVGLPFESVSLELQGIRVNEGSDNLEGDDVEASVFRMKSAGGEDFGGDCLSPAPSFCQ